jgi:hypothetical protein
MSKKPSHFTLILPLRSSKNLVMACRHCTVLKT